MKRYTSKRLDACEVHAVVRRGSAEFPTHLRPVRNRLLVEDPSRMAFCFDGKHIHLPRKKRGDKYIIRYTEMKQVVL